MKTHRCEGSLKRNISIRYCEGIIGHEKQWRLLELVYDYNSPFDPFAPDLNEVCTINYCPFCGEKLGD